MTTSGNPSSNTRLASYRATGTFLTRITPYYPKLMHESFSEVTLNSTVDVKSSAVIASTFGFISTFIARNDLDIFLKTTPVFHHFSILDPQFSDHLAPVISNLGHLGIEWHKNLLHSYLEQISGVPSRDLIKAISAIAHNYPKVMLKEIIEFLKDHSSFSKNLTLLAYLLSNNSNLLVGVDLYPIAETAIQVLSHQASTADLDCAIQLLSIHSDSFRSKVDDEQNGFVHIKIYNYNNSETKECSLEVKLVQSTPSFYLLELPYELVIPNDQDSLLVLSSKFKTLGMIANKMNQVSKIYDIFEKYLGTEYNETTSSAMAGFSLCINKFMKDVAAQRLYSLLRQTIFVKVISWFHASDILNVLKSIDVASFTEKFGDHFFIEVLDTVVQFCFSANEKLSAVSLTTLMDLTTQNNFELVLKTVINHSDIFDSFMFTRTLGIMVAILSEFPSESQQMSDFIRQVTEASLLYTDSVQILSLIFEFISKAHLDASEPNINQVAHIAFSIVQASIESISGIKWENIINNDIKYYTQLIQTDFQGSNTDFVTEPAQDFKSFMDPLKMGLHYLFSLPPKLLEQNMLSQMIVKSTRLFPYEVSTYLLKTWDLHLPEKQELFINKAVEVIQYVGDNRVQAIWTQICMKAENSSSDYKFKEMIVFLHKFAVFYLNHAQESDLKLAIPFIEFLLSFDTYEDTNTVHSYISCCSDKEKSLILSPTIINKFPDIFEGIKPVTPIKKVEIQLGQDKIAIPTKFNEIQCQYLFEQIVRTGDLDLLDQLLKLALENKFNLSIKYIKFPPATIPLVARYLMVSDPNVFSTDEALSKVRTSWRPLCIKKLEQNPNKLVESLLEQEKVKRHVILDLMSTISDIKYDTNRLEQFAYKILLKAKTLHKFQTALRFMAVTIYERESLSVSFSTTFIGAIEGKLKEIDSCGLALCLLLISKKMKVDKEFYQFTKKITSLVGRFTVSYEQICMIFVPVYNNNLYFGRSYIADITESINLMLNSDSPSMFIAGATLLEQVALTLPIDQGNQVIAQTHEVIIRKFRQIARLPNIMMQLSKTVCCIILQSRLPTVRMHLINATLNQFKLSPLFASFVDSLRIYPIALRVLLPASEAFQQISNYSLDLMSSSFRHFIYCTKERITKLKNDNDAIETLILDLLLSWVKMTHSPLTLSYELDQFIVLMKPHFTPEHILSIICFQIMKSLDYFHPVLLSIAKFIKETKISPEIKEIISNAIILLPDGNHKKAFEVLNDQCDYKEAMKLALSSDVVCLLD